MGSTPNPILSRLAPGIERRCGRGEKQRHLRDIFVQRNRRAGHGRWPKRCGHRNGQVVPLWDKRGRRRARGGQLLRPSASVLRFKDAVNLNLLTRVWVLSILAKHTIYALFPLRTLSRSIATTFAEH